MIRQLQTCALGLFLAVTIVALTGCRHAPDEDQVRQAIAAVAHAAQTGDAGGVVKPLTDDFDGNAGDLDKRALANMMRLVGLRGDHIGVITGPVGIEHRGDRMIATLTVTLTSGGHVLPDQLGVYQVQSAWRKDDGQWRCYSATWKSPSQ
jgi:ketosteroid isomerase-like protein